MDDGELHSSQPFGLDEAYSVKTPDDNRRLYAKWATTYESAFVDAQKYRYPRAIAEVFVDVVPAAGITTIVDIGTGTGLVGSYLSALRHHYIIDGIDISPEMLTQARKKQRADGSFVYQDLFERDLTRAVATPNAPYDALICSGTFTHGHLGPNALPNILALIRPNGWCVIGVNNEHYVANGFEEKLAELTDSGSISNPEIRMIDVYDEGSPHRGDQARVLLFNQKS